MKKKTLINLISMEFLFLRWRFFSLQDVLVARSQGRPLYSQTTNLKTYNWRQNELRHFTLNWAFCMLYWLQKEEIQLFLPHPLHASCADVCATNRKQQTPQLWMEGQGRGVDFFVLWSYPIWVQCLNNNILSPIVGWILHWLNVRTDFTYKNNLILPLVTSAIFFSKSCKNNRCKII